MDLFSYLPVVVTVAAGILGAFFAKSGERTRVGGIGWLLVGLMVASGALSLVIEHRKSVRAGIASAAAARAEEDNRRLQLRQVALLTSTIGGFDLDKPLESGMFGMDMPVEDAEVVQLDGFVGPFPELGTGGSAVLSINIPDVLDVEFDLTPVSSNALRLLRRNSDGQASLLRRQEGFADFVSPAPTDSAPMDEVPSAYVWMTEALGNEFSYLLMLPSELPTRALISRLAQTDAYGALTIRVPNMTPADRRRIEAAYEEIRPFFMFHPKLLSATSEEDGCFSRIQVPLRFRLEPEAKADAMTFVIQAEPKGFDTVICGWVP